MKYYERASVMNEVAKVETTNLNENQMIRVLEKCEVDREEPKGIPFGGFDGELLVLKVVPDTVGKHAHLEIWKGERNIGYLHIDQKGIFFWTRDERHSCTARLVYKDAV